MEALKQKIKALLCPPLPQPLEIVDTPNPPQLRPLLSSAFILQASVPAGQVAARGLEGGQARSQGSRAGSAATRGVGSGEERAPWGLPPA